MNKLYILMLILLISINTASAYDYDTDFNNGSFMGWTGLTGTWTISSWELYNSCPYSAGYCTVNKSITNGSYSYFEYDIKFTKSNNYCAGATADNCARTTVYLKSPTVGLNYYSKNTGNYGLSGIGAGLTDIVIPPGTWIHVEIEADGNSLIVSHTNKDTDTLILMETVATTTYNFTNEIKISAHGNYYFDEFVQNTYFDNFIASSSNVDSPTGGTINFNQDSYNLGDIAYIDATLINPDYNNYGYRTIIYNPDGSINHAHMWTEPTTSQAGFSINIEQLGTYTAKIQRFTGLFSYTDLDTDTAVGKYQNNALMSVFFNDSYYNTGDTVLIQSNISNINNSLYFYEIMIIKPNGNFYNVHNITANESYSFVTNVPGEWQVSLTSYPKSDSSMIENQVSDTMVTYGTSVGASWVSFNDTYYNKNSWARIDYGISVNDFYDSHKMQITNQEGTVVFDRQIIAQSGYFDYYFYESGKYTVTIDRNWFALEWDLTDNEILATDVTEVTNTIEGGFTLGITPITLNCGQTVYLSAETPNFWNTTNFTIKDVNGTLITTILGQSGKWKTNQTGQFWVYLNDAGAVQDSGYFYVYGTCTGYDQISQDGSGGIKPKPYPQTDQATSNAALQNNLLYFMGLPIFWGMIIFCGILVVAATVKAGRAIPYLAPVIIMFELVIGMLEPYSSYIAVGMAIVMIMYFIANFAVGYNQGSS